VPTLSISRAGGLENAEVKVEVIDQFNNTSKKILI